MEWFRFNWVLLFLLDSKEDEDRLNDKVVSIDGMVFDFKWWLTANWVDLKDGDDGLSLDDICGWLLFVEFDEQWIK